MKRYTVIDNEKKLTSHYSRIQWDFAWWLMFCIGFATGVILSL